MKPSGTSMPEETEKPARPRIWATVVTRNRLGMLQDCINALRAQTHRPDIILVVDNESSDETPAWLDTQEDLKVVRQENTGSAGGQHTAFRTAYEGGADWIWTMDDDVRPAPDALEELLHAAKIAGPVSLVASRVVSPDGESVNVPGLDLSAPPNRYAPWERLLAHGLVAINETTFVSILVKRGTIKAVGYPLADLFIWGDDTEFSRRCTAFAPAFLVGKSVAEHRRATAEPLSIWREPDTARLRAFRYLYRNQAYIAKTHGQLISRRNQQVSVGPVAYCLLLLLFSIGEAIRHRRIRPLLTIAAGTLAGMKANFQSEGPA